MKLVRIKFNGECKYAIVEGQNVISVDGDIFNEWHPSDHKLSLKDADFLCPVRPPQVIAIGLNYSQHAEETGMAIPKAPQFFLKGVNSVIGPNDNIVLPKMAPNEVDYEAELVIVMGKKAKNISKDEAGKYILGYTCGNDVSARDCQLRLDSQWARGKSFDTFAPIGPHIETELDPTNLEIRLTLNGTVMQHSNTSDMIFSCDSLVSYLSHCMTLLPGSVVMTGTPQGVGFSRKPPVFIKSGDLISIEIENIGRLTNKVIKED